VIVCDFYFGCNTIVPVEAYTPLIIDPNAVLTLSISRQSLKTITGWNPQIIEISGPLQDNELPQSNGLHFSWKLFREFASPNSLCFFVRK